MGNHKKYWKSELELINDSSIVDNLKNNEFVKELPLDAFQSNESGIENSNTNRRDFLKYLGFSTAAATLASCEGPVNRSIPYVVQPEQIIPGISNFYATSVSDGFDFANVLVNNVDSSGFNLRKSHHNFNLILGASPPFLSMSRQASSPKPYARSYKRNTSPFGESRPCLLKLV